VLESNFRVKSKPDPIIKVLEPTHMNGLYHPTIPSEIPVAILAAVLLTW
jgi:hypothetical protein